MSLTSSGEYIGAARSHLEDGRSCFGQGLRGTAVSEAYFSMIASVNAILLKTGHRTRKSHSGVLNATYHILIEKLGLLALEDHSAISTAKEYRWSWHYEAVEPPETDARRSLARAEQVLEVAESA